MINRKELARRIAHEGNYKVGDMDQVLSLLEDVIEYAVQNGEGIKLGKTLKIEIETRPEKRAYNGFNKTYFIREEKRVPKVELLSRLKDIQLPPDKEE